MDPQGCRLGLESFLSHLWAARGRSGTHDHLSSCQVFKSSKTKSIPNSSANAVVVVSVIGLVTVVVVVVIVLVVVVVVVVVAVIVVSVAGLVTVVVEHCPLTKSP